MHGQSVKTAPSSCAGTAASGRPAEPDASQPVIRCRGPGCTRCVGGWCRRQGAALLPVRHGRPSTRRRARASMQFGRLLRRKSGQQAMAARFSKWNGTMWTQQPGPSTMNVLDWGAASSTNLWAVGPTGVYKFDGTNWTKQTVPTAGPFVGVGLRKRHRLRRWQRWPGAALRRHDVEAAPERHHGQPDPRLRRQHCERVRVWRRRPGAAHRNVAGANNLNVARWRDGHLDS